MHLISDRDDRRRDKLAHKAFGLFMERESWGFEGIIVRNLVIQLGSDERICDVFSESFFIPRHQFTKLHGCDPGSLNSLKAQHKDRIYRRWG